MPPRTGTGALSPWNVEGAGTITWRSAPMLRAGISVDVIFNPSGGVTTLHGSINATELNWVHNPSYPDQPDIQRGSVGNFGNRSN